MLARLIAELDVGAPSTLIPIGTVTGMLVAVFVLFLRDSARNDQRADIIAAKLVAAAEAERDRARADAEKRIEELALQLAQANRDVREREERWTAEKQQLTNRIEHLEMMLYGRPPTAPETS